MVVYCLLTFLAKMMVLFPSIVLVESTLLEVIATALRVIDIAIIISGLVEVLLVAGIARKMVITDNTLAMVAMLSTPL
jgi:hypothetical protein